MAVKVLWVIDHVCYDGSLHGGGRLYWNLLPRFDPEACRVTACLLRATPEIREVFEDSPYPIRILEKGKFDPSTLTTLLRLIREERIDVLHLHCYGASTFGRLAGLIAGVPAVIHDYDTEVYFPYPWYLGFADAALARSTGRAIAASPMVEKFQIERRKIAPKRVDLMFHAIPTERFEAVSAERRCAARRELGVGDETVLVGTVTKLGPQRGNEFLIEATAALLRENPDVRLVMVYQPTRLHRLPNKRYVPISAAEQDGRVTELREAARRFAVEDRVDFIEKPEDVHALISTLDVFVAPFLSERFSSVHLLEAMAAGRPVIATELGEAARIVKDEVGGFLVPPGDVASLADRLSRLAADRQLRKRLGERARNDARQYGADACARRLETLYTELAGRGGDSERGTAA